MTLTRRRNSSICSFTLVEMLVALAVLGLILVMVYQMLASTSSLFRMTDQEVDSFQSARNAFQAITRTLPQATLNNAWVNQAGTTQFSRHSDLQFVTGPASTLLSGAPQTWISQAVFFQAPLGFSTNTASAVKMSNVLNVVGYGVQFGSDAALRPAFLASSTIPLRYRFRLMETCQASENFSVYTATPPNADWYLTPLSDAASTHVLAENIIALFVMTQVSSYDTAAKANNWNNSYSYDSQSTTLNGGADLNQLPPIVQVTLVAIDEPSAARLQAKNGSTMPTLISPSLFQDAANYQDDLTAMEATLGSLHINYRVFSTSVPILQAKWSSP